MAPTCREGGAGQATAVGSVSGWASSSVCQAVTSRVECRLDPVAAQGVRQAQVALERAGEPEPRARGEQDVVPAGGADEPAGHRRARGRPTGSARPTGATGASRGRCRRAGRAGGRGLRPARRDAPARPARGRRSAGRRPAAPAPDRRGRSRRAAPPSRRTIGAEVRIQPIRNPPHSTLAAEPDGDDQRRVRRTVRRDRRRPGRRASARRASRRSAAGCRCAGRARRAAPARRRRAARPVGFWWSGTR